MRMPISRLRSVTLTSMLFMTPMPPTSSEIAATEPSSTVSVFCVSVAEQGPLGPYVRYRTDLPAGGRMINAGARAHSP